MSTETNVSSREARSEQPYYKWIVLGTVIFALLIILLDITVVNVSIPRIMTDFGTNISNVEWVFNAYTLAFAATLITFGKLGDMFGHKNLFLGGLVVFGAASAASGAAPSIDWLIVFRTFQGLGAAMMMPATLALMLSAFPPHQRGLALGFWGAMAGVALAIGPVLGGWLTDDFSWRWIFYINIPVVILAIILTLTFIHGGLLNIVFSFDIFIRGFRIAAGFTLAGAIISLFIRQRRRTEPDQKPNQPPVAAAG